MQTLQAAQIYADQVGSEANRVAAGYFNNLNARMITTNNLASAISTIGSFTCNTIHINTNLYIGGQSLTGLFTQTNGRIATIEGILRQHGWM